jgi:hypothetical protein
VLGEPAGGHDPHGLGKRAPWEVPHAAQRNVHRVLLLLLLPLLLLLLVGGGGRRGGARLLPIPVADHGAGGGGGLPPAATRPVVLLVSRLRPLPLPLPFLLLKLPLLQLLRLLAKARDGLAQVAHLPLCRQRVLFCLSYAMPCACQSFVGGVVRVSAWVCACVLDIQQKPRASKQAQGKQYVEITQASIDFPKLHPFPSTSTSIHIHTIHATQRTQRTSATSGKSTVISYGAGRNAAAAAPAAEEKKESGSSDEAEEEEGVVAAAAPAPADAALGSRRAVARRPVVVWLVDRVIG